MDIPFLILALFFLFGVIIGHELHKDFGSKKKENEQRNIELFFWQRKDVVYQGKLGASIVPPVPPKADYIKMLELLKSAEYFDAQVSTDLAIKKLIILRDFVDDVINTNIIKSHRLEYLMNHVNNENMDITKEMLIELYKKSEAFFLLKTGVKPDFILIDDEGDLAAEYCQLHDDSKYIYASLDEIS